uniref:IFT81 calponin homology domain-containing protein n=1 Tax=Palpitomonas bilix TaxID=652834 RepID=A0A7S3CYY0_9EUKA|mmetsp:Transcript_15289/g.38623  ORF Transcript_15289/g.38623 Transcript_15289/m.38623 type:complete len:678 (+) Transcript_15289:231-2264(+)|eukprot:CAMPEP_0113892004 /NCGR_PEP_ID=MMETSP0780_2-20120614/15129_1 /TAXON_ID=652834 /ORGANISM="Palpitomonas bilix" /LENGTH=677 /DNA_ID=CAMNT_0000881801 /DNA_START=116 /DNA_END=2149 /DNA_ORIENTATION=- /assembly_acc=CAM_ASM_000599
MADTSFIVDSLNSPPFDFNLTLITFDEKRPTELLQVLNDVFAHLNSDQKRVIRDEDPEEMSVRMTEFLRILNFKHTIDPEDFRMRIKSGDKGTIYHILHWMLQRLPDLEKRAYVGKFLVQIPVPEDMFAEETIQETYQQYMELQKDFKSSHKNWEKMKKTSTNIPTNDLKNAVASAEDEKKQLVAKIQKIKASLEGVPNFAELYSVTSALRKEQEQELRLADQYMQQKQMLESLDSKLDRASQQLQSLRAGGDNMDPSAILTKMNEDVENSKNIISNDLSKQIESKQEHLHGLREIVSSQPASDMDISRFQAQVTSLQNEVREIRAKNEEAAMGGGGVAMARQQAARIQQLKEEKKGELNELNAEIAAIDRQIQAKQQEIQKARGNMPQLDTSGDAFKTYTNSLRQTSAVYKQKKAELGELKSEWGVLQQTLQILQSRHSDLKNFMDEMEKKKGITGYTNTNQKIVEVSKGKAQLDEMKGKALEEVSYIVQAIASEIKEKKAKLAPQIKELRALQQKARDLEADYKEKKNQYTSMKLALESEQSRLADEVRTLQSKCSEEEAAYHTLRTQINHLQLVWERAYATARAAAEGGTGENKREKYKAYIGSQEKEAKKLREQQKKVKESHEPNVKQQIMLRDLRKLVDAKLRVAKEMQNQSRIGNGLSGPGGLNTFTIDEE